MPAGVHGGGRRNRTPDKCPPGNGKPPGACDEALRQNVQLLRRPGSSAVGVSRDPASEAWPTWACRSAASCTPARPARRPTTTGRSGRAPSCAPWASRSSDATVESAEPAAGGAEQLGSAVGGRFTPPLAQHPLLRCRWRVSLSSAVCIASRASMSRALPGRNLAVCSRRWPRGVAFHGEVPVDRQDVGKYRSRRSETSSTTCVRPPSAASPDKRRLSTICFPP